MPADNINNAQHPDRLEACPHCGHKLSPWQQVLLSVDRMLTCKNCWYRITLDIYHDEPDNKTGSKENKQPSTEE